ncbi:hypothetical protein [Clostridium nigeriense]|uniref:hypothetical protein n=1 Tax=Clostridium nigeriense TaxID=1805470 RepID=UPI000834FAA0|nr:hypothetical protein [Clostridium nigeriense]
MKKKFEIFLLIIVIVSVGSYIYAVFPRRGTIETLILNKIDNIDFTNITIRESNDKEYRYENKYDIKNFLDNIKGIKIKEDRIKQDKRNVTEVRMYSKYSSGNLGFVIFDDKYIKVYSDTKGRHNTVIYKVTDDTSIINYLENIKSE